MMKKKLRKKAQIIRDGIPHTEKSRLDKKIIENLLSWSVFQKSKYIFCYVSFRSEVDTMQVIHYALNANITVAVPEINLNLKKMKACIISSASESLVSGEYGIQKPHPACPEADYEKIDLIIAPGLAFSPNGERLGYGGGYYDKFLEKYGKITTCALTYDILIFDSLPVKDHDRPVDYLITESGVKNTQREQKNGR